MYSVAIDGPAGAGKSSIAKMVSKKTGVLYLDTGALYRAFGYYFIKNNISVEDLIEVEDAILKCDIKIFCEDEQKVFVNGKRVDKLIRNDEVSMVASLISKNITIRKHLLKIQREYAKNNSVIMDGRDIGTVVLPDADLKIFLTARVEVRAKRRFEELLKNGYDIDYEEVLKSIKERDLNDSKREIAPLKVADDAVVIDTSDISLEESVNKVIFLIRKINLEEHC